MKLYILIILLFTSVAYANVTVDKENDHIFFGDSIEFFEDRNNLTFNEILKQKLPWQKSSSKSLNFGLTKSACWIRFEIENKSESDLYVTFNTISIDLIKLYLPDKNGRYIEKTGGVIYPFNHREIRNKDIFFIIPAYSCGKTIYARIISDYLVVFTPEILVNTKIGEREDIIFPAYFIYFGLLIAMFMYNFFLYVSLRERSYLALILLLIAYVFHDLAHDNLGFMYFWPESTYFESIAIVLSVGLAGVTTGYFLQLTLETKKKYRVVHWIITFFMITCGLMSILCFFLPRDISSEILFFNVFLISVCTILPLVYLVFVKRNRSAVFVLISFIVMDISGVVASLMSSPSLVKFIPVLSNYLAMVFLLKFARGLCIMLFSLMLADKINLMKRDLEIGEETYRSIFNGTNEAISIWDTDNFRVIDANRPSLKMFNMTIDEIIGKDINYFSSVDDGFEFNRAMEHYAAMIEGDFKPYEWIAKRSNGERFWAELTINNVMLNGVQRLMVVVRNVEDRKKAEAEREKMLNQLTQAQKMEAVGSLSGGLAHDFNNYLTGIMASSTLLEAQAEENKIDREKIKKYTGIITRASAKASDTVRRLLTLTKKQELKFTSSDLNNAIKNVIEICLNSFPKSVTIQVKYFNEPAYINADNSSLEQALLNIMVNASHALTIMRSPGEKEGGIISVETGRIYADDAFCASTPGLAKTINYFTVSIHDNGCGIDKEIIDKIFDPFFSTKGKEGGTGLGLSMVYSIVRQHNGIIKVYSEKGEGSTFILYLPEDIRGKSSEPEDINGVIKWHGRILIIDDEDFIREVAGDILTNCGYETDAAPGGREGIEFFRENADRIDAVLLDTSMPGLTGLDTFKELKRIKPSIRVIMTSGFGMDERAQAAINLGADSFIQKPYTKVQLSRAMYKLLKG